MSDTPRMERAANESIAAVYEQGCQLERELAEVTEQLHHAVGLLSTTPQFENQHPEDILIYLKGGQQ